MGTFSRDGIFRVVALATKGFLFFPFVAEAITYDLLLENVRKFHPLQSEAIEKVKEVTGNETASLGFFDPSLKFDSQRKIESLYKNTAGEVALSQQTPWIGTELSVFHARGLGDFAPYDGDLKTSTQGEFGLKVRQPLLKGSVVDESRFKIAESSAKVDVENSKVSLVQLSLLSDASISYFKWLAEIEKNEVSLRLLELAEKRQEKLSRRVKQGDLAKLILADNERLMLERQTDLIQSKVSVQKSAMGLSLFFRDLEGNPTVPNEVKETLRIWADPLMNWKPKSTKTLAEGRPELKIFEIEKDIAERERSLANNQILPSLDLFAQTSKDAGYTDPNLNQREYKLGIELSFPLLMRKGRGRSSAAEAKIEQIKYRKSWFQERLSNSLNQTVAEVLAAQEKLAISEKYLSASRSLERAEQLRFNAGSSDLINVNIRESATAKAEKAVIQARYDLVESAVRYWINLGKVDLSNLLRTI